MPSPVPLPENKLAYSPEEAALSLGLGVTSIYALLKEGRLRRLKFGRRTLIPRESMQRFLDGLDVLGPGPEGGGPADP